MHAFPPNSEGYVDASVKIFLRLKGQFVARRHSSRTNYTALRWLRVLDARLDDLVKRRHQRVAARAAKRQAAADKEKEKDQDKDDEGTEGAAEDLPVCGLCGLDSHVTPQHRCHFCTERGSHRGSACPNRASGCQLCGDREHATGEHQCSVCKLPGHRGRDCHAIGDVGVAELAAYFSFHDFCYYSGLLASLVDEDPDSLRRRGSATEGAAAAGGRATPSQGDANTTEAGVSETIVGEADFGAAPGAEEAADDEAR